MDRIKQLLSAEAVSNPHARRCLAAVEEDRVSEISETEPLPVQKVLEIYTWRASWNKKRGGDITGFDDLLKNLQATAFPMVRVRSIFTADERFVIFTDDLGSKLLGILSKVPLKDVDSTN